MQSLCPGRARNRLNEAHAHVEPQACRRGSSGLQVEQQEAKHTHCQPGVVSLIIRDAKKRFGHFPIMLIGV